MIKLHHLDYSRSSRIIWLCVEAGINYEMVTYHRDPVTRRSPPELAEAHRLAKAPTVDVDRIAAAISRRWWRGRAITRRSNWAARCCCRGLVEIEVRLKLGRSSAFGSF